MILYLAVFLFLNAVVPALGEGYAPGDGMYHRCDTVADCDNQRDCSGGEAAYCGEDNECHCRKSPMHCHGLKTGTMILDVTDPTCSTFLMCRHFPLDPQKMPCPPGLIFDIVKQNCRFRCADNRPCEYGSICPIGKDNSKAATTTPTTTPAEKEDSDEKDSEEVSTCDDVDCGDHGQCSEGQDGQAECSCETGFAGDRCQRQHSDIRCDSMYDCDRRCGRPNTQCLDTGFCDCDANYIPAADAYEKTHNVGDGCSFNQQCHGICDQPMQGRCLVPEFKCACLDLGDMQCVNSADCHVKCASKVGICEADGYCVCEKNAFQMTFKWWDDLKTKVQTLEEKLKGTLTSSNSVPADSSTNEVAPKKLCTTSYDCADQCGGNSDLAVCLESGECVC